MALKVIRPGLQTSLQGMPYLGRRHLGMPGAGAADSLSLALANHLVGNKPDQLALELTLDSAEFLASEILDVALTGAATEIRINDQLLPSHRNLTVRPGDRIVIDAVRHGCRSYLAIGGCFEDEHGVQASSTYLPARIGGLQGRILAADDELHWRPNGKSKGNFIETPAELRPHVSDQYLLRVIPAAESNLSGGSTFRRLVDQKWQIGHRSSRMGIALDGPALNAGDAATMNSAAVFPGTVQCPPEGKPFLLGADAQTTGGYPRLAQVIRADRHLIGQLRPGNALRFVNTSVDRAQQIYREKVAILQKWVGPVNLW